MCLSREEARIAMPGQARDPAALRRGLGPARMAWKGEFSIERPEAEEGI
jgi:hypothetical protein